MNIFIYESSSRGGCYEYSKYLLEAYKKVTPHAAVIVPANCKDDISGSEKILLKDSVEINNKIYRKLHFLLRQFLNPIILFFFLLRKDKSLVILNDFEQISAPVWAPLYRFFLKKHRFAVVLHDPDRDNYPPSRKVSEYCMRKLMSCMDLGLYHEYLPEKKYYQHFKTKFLKVPHGLFKTADKDVHLLKKIKEEAAGNKLVVIIGNIRAEKNYDLAINALPQLPGWKLLIAGAPANSSVSVDEFKNLATEKGVSERVIWIDKFLSDAEMSSVISIADLILLYYKKSFTSQSGILNLVAPYEKKVLISDTSSSLTEVGKKFNLGTMVEPDSLQALQKGIIESEDFSNDGWKSYKEYASWDKHISVVLSALKDI